VGGSFATSLDDQRVLLGTSANELVLVALEPRTRSVLATFTAQIERILVRQLAARWVVTALADGTLVRHDLSSGTQTQTRGGVFSPGLDVTAAASGGDVYFAAGATLRRWTPEGHLSDFGTLPRPIQATHLLNDEHILVVTDDGSKYLAGVSTRRFVRMPAFGATYTWASLAATLIVADDGTGGIIVLDTVANASFKIARATPSNATPDITSDGSTVIMRDAALDSTAIAFWRLELPWTAEETARWVDSLTNATFDARTGTLGWAPL
jgi:hypothetical protein